MSTPPAPAKAAVAFLLKDLKGGGVQTMTVAIANAFAERGHRVELLVCKPDGPARERVADSINIVAIPASPRPLARLTALRADPAGLTTLWRPILATRETSGTLRHLPGLVAYLREQQPQALYTGTPYMNVEAALACQLAGRLAATSTQATGTRLIISEHNDLSRGHPLGSGWRKRHLPPLLARYYRRADAIVAVSKGVADDLMQRTGLPAERLQVIYNAVVTPELAKRALEPLEFPWFAAGEPPVILGVGRLGRAKDFPTLVRALAAVRKTRPARLLILGEATNARRSAKRKAELDELAGELGIESHIRLQGFVDNPFPYMRQAAVFALSSLYEGFGNVLVEAMACGTPVVSTDCPSGPAEILEQGRYGPLVPVGDHQAMAAAILDILAKPPDPELLSTRAAEFSVARAVDQYEALLSRDSN